jgi:putative ABC transport system substrate-binding protein
VIGFIRSTSPASGAPLVAALRKGLAEAGFIEGQNVAIEQRYAHDDRARLPVQAAELVQMKVAAIVTHQFSTRPAMRATGTVPIVFVAGNDPVRSGFVPSLARPGGNVTGITFFGGASTAKRLQLLHELAPKSGAIAVLLDPNSVEFALEMREAEETGKSLGREIRALRASTPPEIDAAFAAIRQNRSAALLVGSGAFLGASQRHRLLEFAAREAIVAIYILRQFVEAGGLMSYGNNQPDAYRQAGHYVARILKGEKPGDLPVMRATKFDLFINLRTAKALGLHIPPTLLARADEVIE